MLPIIYPPTKIKNSRVGIGKFKIINIRINKITLPINVLNIFFITFFIFYLYIKSTPTTYYQYNKIQIQQHQLK